MCHFGDVYYVAWENEPTILNDPMTDIIIIIAGLLGEVDVLKVQLEGAVAGGNETEVGVAIQRLQRCMLAVRELGNLKMEMSSQLVDTVSILPS